jgi:hypothetical protein
MRALIDFAEIFKSNGSSETTGTDPKGFNDAIGWDTPQSHCDHRILYDSMGSFTKTFIGSLTL